MSCWSAGYESQYSQSIWQTTIGTVVEVRLINPGIYFDGKLLHLTVPYARKNICELCTFLFIVLFCFSRKCRGGLKYCLYFWHLNMVSKFLHNSTAHKRPIFAHLKYVPTPTTLNQITVMKFPPPRST